MNSMGQEHDKGVSNIDLRSMGTNRSLVLVDGHRWVSGGARTAAVDLNTIPSAMVERIETVTGGASAIYGADAVTGAVNVVMKKRMDGTTATLTTVYRKCFLIEIEFFNSAAGARRAGRASPVLRPVVPTPLPGGRSTA